MPTHVARIHADLVIKAAYTSIGDIYNLLYTVVNEFMRDADRDGFGVIGIYSSTME